MKMDAQEINLMLKEVSCDELTAEQISALLLSGDIQGAKILLRRHRKYLMDELHESEKRVDTLDLFIYQIEKSEG